MSPGLTLQQSGLVYFRDVKSKSMNSGYPTWIVVDHFRLNHFVSSALFICDFVARVHAMEFKNRSEKLKKHININSGRDS